MFSTQCKTCGSSSLNPRLVWASATFSFPFYSADGGRGSAYSARRRCSRDIWSVHITISSEYFYALDVCLDSVHQGQDFSQLLMSQVPSANLHKITHPSPWYQNILSWCSYKKTAVSDPGTSGRAGRARTQDVWLDIWALYANNVDRCCCAKIDVHTFLDKWIMFFILQEWYSKIKKPNI